MAMSPIRKLKADAQRFKADQSLGSGFLSNLRLILVVDFWPVFWFRMMEYCLWGRPSRFKKIFKFFIVILRPIAEGFSGARIMPGAQIGAGLLLHQSVGVVICAEAVIGENCTLFAGSCIVHRADGKGLGAPVISDNAFIALGALIIGPVSIGNNAIVGANSSVFSDVGDGVTVIGSPARPL